jgi:hypothetical protein
MQSANAWSYGRILYRNYNRDYLLWRNHLNVFTAIRVLSPRRYGALTAMTPYYRFTIRQKFVYR